MESISAERTKIHIEEARDLLKFTVLQENVFSRENAVITNGAEGILSLLTITGVTELENAHGEIINLSDVAQSVSHLNEEYFDLFLDGAPEYPSKKDEQAVKDTINNLIERLEFEI